MSKNTMNALSEISGMDNVVEVCGGTKDDINERDKRMNIRFTIIHNVSDEIAFSNGIVRYLASIGYTRPNEPIVYGSKGKVLCFDFSK